jgi:hypothetical protein
VSPEVMEQLEEGGYLFAEDYVLVEAFEIRG